MRATYSRLLLSSISSVPFILAAAQASAASCEDLKNLKLKDTTITAAQTYAPGGYTPTYPAWRRGAGQPAVTVGFCRVAGSIKPTSDSDIKFELWLPLPDKWTGRYESVGNGGFAGTIRYDSMRRPLLGGTAVASTDDGHDTPGAEFALNAEKLADYAYRAVHVTAETSKAITTAYYGAKPKHSYFVGCSKGGQEGLMSATRYPADFDGIISLAAANYFTQLFTEFAWNQSLMFASEKSYLSREDLVKISGAVLEACDAQDGVKDGLISNPQKCRVKRESIPLPPEKVDTYVHMIEGPKTSDGKEFLPGYAVGSEIGSTSGWLSDNIGTGFDQARAGATQSNFARGFFANFVYKDPKWDFANFNLDKGGADAAKAVGKIINVETTDLSAFKARGGKLIQFSGWGDIEVNTKAGIRYYERVVAGPSAKGDVGEIVTDPGSAALKAVQEYYRYFVGAGVSHCRGGNGPNEFGQQGGDGPAESDLVSSLYQWVEKGAAPTQVIATKFTDNNPANPVQMTRPICMYPMVPKYKGQGSPDQAANFVCAANN